MTLISVPFTLKQANAMVETLHRHHKPMQGHRFSIGAVVLETQEVVGAAICGRPVASMLDQTFVLEINRLVTNGHQNACSFLYGKCARIAKEMGFKRIITYTLISEPGVSLKASGWKLSHQTTSAGKWDHPGRKRNFATNELKNCWERIL